MQFPVDYSYYLTGKLLHIQAQEHYQGKGFRVVTLSKYKKKSTFMPGLLIYGYMSLDIRGIPCMGQAWCLTHKEARYFSDQKGLISVEGGHMNKLQWHKMHAIRDHVKPCSGA